MDLPESLKASREGKLFASIEWAVYLDHAKSLRSDQYLEMSIDSSNLEVVDIFKIEEVVQQEPVAVKMDARANQSEAIFATNFPNTYLSISMTGVAINNETLVKLFRDKWRESPSQSSLNPPEIFTLSPGLNKAYLELITAAK